ncbi:MAG TPA: ABC transporter ATP-binding protein [Bacteroidia bacterium]|nr:ABC transporter ATP-binding protein [Bacteroidia bacterium]
MNKVSGKIFDVKLFKRILEYARPYWLIAWFSLGCIILLAVATAYGPLLTKKAINIDIGKNHDIHALLITALLWFSLLILRGVFQFMTNYSTNLLGQKIIKDMRINLYTHVLNLRLQFFDQTPIGMLITRVTSDMEVIEDVFSEGIITILSQLLMLVLVIGVMIYINWKLALLSLSVIPVLLFATYLFQKATRESFQEVRVQVAKLNSFVQEHITGMNIVQIFNREQIEFDRFKQINNDHKIANIRSIWYYSIFFPVVDILSQISIALVVWYAGKGILYGISSPGEIIAFMQFLNLLFVPIRQMSDKINTLQMGVVSAERIFKVFDTQTFIDDTGKIESAKMEGNIAFNNVWFAYNDENWVLKDVSFNVKSGQTLAIVGATGAGKSSMINILGRFYDYQKGSISIDGKDLRDYKIDTLRKNIAIVLQDVFLFSDTIANNITLYNKSITPAQMQYAAAVIGAEEFINSLPEGYNFNVMERGAVLSAGQRQLVSFIRAYVQNPGILILDEATSSIDTETERLIQHAIEKLTEHRTSIIIAHRLATIQRADKILVLDHGQVVEEGTHQELLRKGGYYKNLYEIQFEKQEKVKA